VTPSQRTAWICERAREVGFDLCGVADPEALAELANLPEWLARGYAGEMKYMQDARRMNPRLVLEGVRSVIVVAVNYNSAQPHSTDVPLYADEESPRGWISRYAWGDDYHEAVGGKLDGLVAAMRAQFEEPFEARAYVDTGPVLERVAAKHAGLGWLAKNTCLINQELGSWLFLGVILTTLDLAPSVSPGELPPADLCGNCTLCLDACPTEAFAAPYVLDARRCISYLTIELRGAVPLDLRAGMGRHLFGCDICQDVCPWNRRAAVTGAPAFAPWQMERARNSKHEIRKSGTAEGSTVAAERALGQRTNVSLLAPEVEWIAGLSQEEFSAAFRRSAVKRAKWRGMVRNACIALGNAQLPRDSAARAHVMHLLESLAQSPDELIAEHARWALERIERRNSKYENRNSEKRKREK